MPIIYEVSYFHNDVGHLLEWAGSMREAKKIKNRIIANDIAEAQDEYADALARDIVADGVTYHNLKKVDADLIRITQHRFPETKTGVIRWLNAYYNTDNG